MQLLSVGEGHAAIRLMGRRRVADTVSAGAAGGICCSVTPGDHRVVIGLEWMKKIQVMTYLVRCSSPQIVVAGGVPKCCVGDHYPVNICRKSWERRIAKKSGAGKIAYPNV